VRGNNPRRLLPAMLQRMQAQVGELLRFGMSEDRHDPTLVMEFIRNQHLATSLKLNPYEARHLSFRPRVLDQSAETIPTKIRKSDSNPIPPRIQRPAHPGKSPTFQRSSPQSHPQQFQVQRLHVGFEKRLPGRMTAQCGLHPLRTAQIPPANRSLRGSRAHPRPSQTPFRPTQRPNRHRSSHVPIPPILPESIGSLLSAKRIPSPDRVPEDIPTTRSEFLWRIPTNRTHSPRP